MKYIICFSGGHSSALTAIEAVRKHGKENVILLNHNISSIVEHKDIKRFKNDIADYLGLKISYANIENFENKTPLQVCRDIKAFKVGLGKALCTNRLKTEPFKKWLDNNYPIPPAGINEDITVIYGFDANEIQRVNRRIGVMSMMGYKTDYPLALWERTIYNTEEIGIKRPITYELFKHANCIGCLKAGRQHWYMVYCMYPAIFKEAKIAENEIGYSILDGVYLEELECKFKAMQDKGIVLSEKINPNTFWAMVRKALPDKIGNLPCECAI